MKKLILTFSLINFFILGISSFSFGDQTLSLTAYDDFSANSTKQITFKWKSDDTGLAVIKQDCGANATYVDTDELRRALNFIHSLAND